MKKMIQSTVSAALLVLCAAGSAQATIYTEDFEGTFPAWESGWFGTMSDATNVYCGARNCSYRGNNPDGLWLWGSSGIEVAFNNAFASSLQSLQLDVAGYTPTRLTAFDVNGLQIFDQNIALTSGAYTDPGVYSTYTITSVTGIKRIEFSDMAAGNTSIDNLVAITANTPNSEVPEPATLGLLGLGLTGLAVARRKYAKKV